MENLKLAKGYVPGLIGRITELHAAYYAREWNFGHYFEARVATELAGFITGFDETRDGIWSLSGEGAIEGSLVIDGSSEPDHTAHLRWFIVSERSRGTGAGHYLMQQAMDFCRQKSFKTVYLWSFKGLAPARHLYLKFGFEMVREFEGTQWGTTVMEQRYELQL